MNTGEMYVLKALDNYPWNLEEAIASLSYALSYDENNTVALNLMARVYAEQLFDFEKAEHYFLEALSSDVNAVHVYPHYIQLLLNMGKYEEAQKAIEFALTLKGIDKISVLLKKVALFEKQYNFKKALKLVNEMRLDLIPEDSAVDLKVIVERLKEKKKFFGKSKKAKKSK